MMGRRIFSRHGLRVKRCRRRKRALAPRHPRESRDVRSAAVCIALFRSSHPLLVREILETTHRRVYIYVYIHCRLLASSESMYIYIDVLPPTPQ